MDFYLVPPFKGDVALEFYGTFGPACANEQILFQMFSVGMSGMRLNLSHMPLTACGEWLDAFHRSAARAGVCPRLILDLQGPELRIGDLPQPVCLCDGDQVTLGKGGLPVPPALISHRLDVGQLLLLDDSAIALDVLSAGPDSILCTVKRGGLLHSRKSIAAPGSGITPPTLTQEDLENLSHAAEYGATDLLQPFVRSPEDLLAVRDAIAKYGAGHLRVIAKLENRAGLANLGQLLPYADAFCIARGDLGSDLPLWDLPAAQKQAAAVCRAQKKPFLVATHLLHSMEHSPIPSRAEVCDVFNAALDGAYALLLTGETAVGQYPVEAMDFLCRTGRTAENWMRLHG